ncbi:MAG: SusC/RagA family TonB-linked outer membrane protein [Rikenellaceae bacterium]|nr:SusC/RagA family TonB-linked outer membrane protein [Rikenellaceae bacterium]
MGKKLLGFCLGQGRRRYVRGAVLLLGVFVLGIHGLLAAGLAPEETAQPQTMTIKGTVHDKLNNAPVAGVTVVDPQSGAGTVTHANGEFSLTVPQKERVDLRFSFIGMKTVDVAWSGQQNLNVIMEEETEMIGEIVVTGFFKRKAESFTGSVATYDKEQLIAIGGSNILQGLNTLDPSFNITANDIYGSDPNRLPDIDIRGKTGITDPREEYATDPNQPLFILDGFQVDLEDIVKLNVNRIQSVTLLKDAASTAIYGSKAANGVLVIETVRSQPGKMRIDYGGTFSVDIADLSDYNLMNSTEKLQFEQLSGAYWQSDPLLTLDWEAVYNERLHRVLNGVDTYWLKQPVRNGFTHKHNLNVSGGDNTILYGVNVDYAKTQGAMKDSGNESVGVNFDLSYRTSKIRFSNKITVGYTEAWNPPVSFATFAETNPYNVIPEDKSGQKFLEDFWVEGSVSYHYQVPNPFYNNNLNHLDESDRLNFRDNFVIDWRPLDGMKVEGRFNLETYRAKSEYFKSPYHTDYASASATEKGIYKKTSNERTRYSGQLIASYFRIFQQKHLVNLVGTVDIESSKLKSDSYSVTGFTDDLIPCPAFGSSYSDALPLFNIVESRQANFFINANYVFDQRYTAEFTLRRDGSSNFGRQNLFTTTWSAGIAWNLQNENFLRDKVEVLKLRFSAGNPGNNNVAYSTETTYKYYSKSSLFGNSLYINQYGSYGLDWQKTLKLNAGVDLITRDRRLSLVADVYKSVTDPLIVRMDIPVSTGRDDLQTNMGRNTIKGFDFKLNYNIIQRFQERIVWSVGVNGSHKSYRYSKMGDLTELNDAYRELASLTRYADGAHQTDIWAVRSAGIDPSTEDEVYIKKDGTYTFTYDYHDEVAVGNTEPTLDGVIHTSVRYKGWNAAIYMRYTFGSDAMNTVLFNRIEGLTRSDVLNKNQDKRALYDRWQQPGDVAKFKRIDDLDGKSYLTDRFLQRKNWLSGESLSIGYDFYGEPWLKKVSLENLSVKLICNNLFHWSTIKQERGTEYPYARTVSLSVNVTF